MAGAAVVSSPRPSYRGQPRPGQRPSGRGWPRPGPPPPGPATAPAMNSADSSTGRTDNQNGPGPSGAHCHAPRAHHGLRHRTRRPIVPGNPPRAVQRIALRPCLANRPHSRPRARASRQRARPASLRSGHAASSLWLSSGGDPPRSPPGPETASRSCLPSTATASTATTTSSTSRSAASSGRPQHLVRARPWKASGCTQPRNFTVTSGYTDRATGTQAVRYASVDFPPGPPTARRPRPTFGGVTEFAGTTLSYDQGRPLFVNTRVLVESAKHVWPDGWQALPNRRGQYVLARDKASHRIGSPTAHRSANRTLSIPALAPPRSDRQSCLPITSRAHREAP